MSLIDIDSTDIAEGIDLESLLQTTDMTLTASKANEVDEFFANWEDLDTIDTVTNLFKTSGTTVKKFFTRAKAVINKTHEAAMDRFTADLGNTLYFGEDPINMDEDLIEDIANYYLLFLKQSTENDPEHDASSTDNPEPSTQTLHQEWLDRMASLEAELRTLDFAYPFLSHWMRANAISKLNP